MAEVESMHDGNFDVSSCINGHEEGGGESISPQASAASTVAEWALQELETPRLFFALAHDGSEFGWQLANFASPKSSSRHLIREGGC